MRTTLDLDESLLREAATVAGTKTKTATIEYALRSVLDQAARRRLAALRGRLPSRARAPRRRRPGP